MKKIKFFVLISLVSMAFSCEKSGKKSAEDLKMEVIAIHDEAMEKMPDIQLTIKSLEKLKATFMVDSLNHSHHLAKLPDCDKAIEDLIKGDREMMDWMHNFKKPADGLSEEELMKYFNDEKIKITQINEDIDKGIHEGRYFVRKFYDDIADEHKAKQLGLDSLNQTPIDTAKNKDVQA